MSHEPCRAMEDSGGESVQLDGFDGLFDSDESLLHAACEGAATGAPDVLDCGWATRLELDAQLERVVCLCASPCACDVRDAAEFQQARDALRQLFVRRAQATSALLWVPVLQQSRGPR